jgi:hypothetical protein
MADESQDRTAIDKVIATLNDPVQRARLLARDVDSGVDFDRPIDFHRKHSLAPGVVIGMNEPWTEFTVPGVVSGSILLSRRLSRSWMAQALYGER